MGLSAKVSNLAASGRRSKFAPGVSRRSSRPILRPLRLRRLTSFLVLANAPLSMRCACCGRRESFRRKQRLHQAKPSLVELDRKPSSCPYLYVWNGERFEFVTDFMGGGEMGHLDAPGTYNMPDPDEYVRIRQTCLRSATAVTSCA